MQAEFLLITEKSDALTINKVENRKYRLHFHSNIELCLVLEGEIEVWINDQHRMLRQGELSVAWSYDAHAYRTPSHSVTLSTIIPPRLYHEFSPLLANRHMCDHVVTDPDIFEKIRSGVCAAAATDDELLKKGYVYVILGTLLAHMQPKGDALPADPQLSSEVLLYLNEHFREDLTLDSVAHALGYHPNYLSHIFKSTLHVGFHQYLTLLRLRDAVLLMKNEEKSITDCAFESGFQSLRTFYRAFQAEFGCTPRKLRTDNAQS